MVPLALMGLYAMKYGGALSGILGKKNRKSIDPNWLKQNFGAGAVNEELQQLFNRAINSTQGQQLMANAAETGQQFQTDVARSSAAAGLGPGGGATGGTDIFAGAAAGQAENNLQRGMRASLMESMLPVAQSMVQSRLQAYMGGEENRARQPYEPSTLSDLGGLTEDIGSQSIARYPTGTNADTSLQKNLADQANAPGATDAAPGQLRTIQPTAIGLPSMQNVQNQLSARSTGGGRFYSKMRRFSGGMNNLVQAV
jgi:hypothetical protein